MSNGQTAGLLRRFTKKKKKEEIDIMGFTHILMFILTSHVKVIKIGQKYFP